MASTEIVPTSLLVYYIKQWLPTESTSCMGTDLLVCECRVCIVDLDRCAGGVCHQLSLAAAL